ncbi:15958_t:CDS:1, partial [Racocetra fulgida]
TLKERLPQHFHQFIFLRAENTLKQLRRAFNEIADMIYYMRNRDRPIRLTCFISVSKNKIEIVSFEEDDHQNSEFFRRLGLSIYVHALKIPINGIIEDGIDTNQPPFVEENNMVIDGNFSIRPRNI